MAGRLRIARLDPSAYAAVSDAGGPSAEQHQRLQALIRRHLPGVNASLLAAPSPTADGRYVEWYSDLSGQPRKLTALPDAEQASARAVLEDRLNALQVFAERLPEVDPGAGGLAESLRQALTYPGDDTVYVIGGQPILTFWGHRSALAAVPPSPPAAAPVAEAMPPGTRAPRWPWLVGSILALGLLAFVGWRYSVDFRWPPWIDYKALIAAAENDEQALRDRLAALEAKLAEEFEICRLRDELAAAIAGETPLRERIENLEARAAEDLRICSLRAAMEQARTEEQDLRERMQEARQNLADTRNECWCKKLPPLAAWAREMGSLAFLDGRWRSITPIQAVATGEGLEIVLGIQRERGRLVYEVGAAKRACRGRARASMGSDEFTILVSRAVCPKGDWFIPASMVCSLTDQKTMPCCIHSGPNSFGAELAVDD